MERSQTYSEPCLGHQLAVSCVADTPQRTPSAGSTYAAGRTKRSAASDTPVEIDAMGTTTGTPLLTMRLKGVGKDVVGRTLMTGVCGYGAKSIALKVKLLPKGPQADTRGTKYNLKVLGTGPLKSQRNSPATKGQWVRLSVLVLFTPPHVRSPVTASGETTNISPPCVKVVLPTLTTNSMGSPETVKLVATSLTIIWDSTKNRPKTNRFG
mmetsp:Transcript_14557/g.25916  ORF Transcript_14557/g.25916 Transcript_14557/m.25916 type:complete len:210 (+) Transcript_14557:4532-5161(+)